MEPKTNQTLLPKHIYLDYITKRAAAEGHMVKRGKKKSGYCMPMELHSQKGEVLLTYDQWFNVISVYFETAKVEIIHGKRLNMAWIGNILAKRIQRSYTTAKINWNATLRMGKEIDPETGKERFKKFVYYTGQDYCRIAWERKFGRKDAPVKYKGLFKFLPTNSSKSKPGFKEQFSLALKNNPSLRFRYLFNPYNYGG